MFQRKIDEIFKEVPNVFEIADGIFVVGYHDNGRDPDNTPRIVLKCRGINLKVSIISPILERLYADMGLKSDPRKLETLMEMTLLATNNELQVFLEIINYLSKFLPSTE